MNSAITRRQALRLALASSVALASTGVALSGPVAQEIMAAQASSPVRVLGIRTGPLPSTTDVPEIDATDTDTAGNPSTTSLIVPLIVENIDITTGGVSNLPIPQALPNNTPILMSNEALTGVTSLSSGTIVLTINPVSGATNETSPARLTLLSTPPRTMSVSGLKSDERLGDVVGTRDGGLLGLVMKRNGSPPVVLVNVDLQTGTISAVGKIHLPQARRFRTLTQCPDGTLYTTAIESDGGTILVHLDLGQNKASDVVPLSLDGIVWNNGLQSLMCTVEAQPRLLALGAPRYISPNALYAIDLGDGALTKLREVQSVQATLAPR